MDPIVSSRFSTIDSSSKLRKRWCQVQGDIRSLAQSECRGGVISKAIVFRRRNRMRLWELELEYDVLSRVLGPGRSISHSVNTRPSRKASAAYISDCGNRAARSESTHLIHTITRKLCASCPSGKACQIPCKSHLPPVLQLSASSAFLRRYSLRVWLPFSASQDGTSDACYSETVNMQQACTIQLKY